MNIFMEKYAVNRRQVLKGVGTGVSVGLLTTSAYGKKNSSRNGESGIDSLKVVGTKKMKVRYEPDTVTLETTYKSPALKKRYGWTPPKFVKTTERSKDELGRTGLPNHGSEVLAKQRWETHLGSENEWRSALVGDRQAETNGGVSIQHDHHQTDRGNCGRAVWNYEKVKRDGETKYDRSAPINVVLKGVDVNDVGDTLTDEGWSNLENGSGAEGKRYAWDMDREMFVGPDNEPRGAYGGWGSKSGLGVAGRMHARCYELEDGIVSIQSHEDDDVVFGGLGHQVASYQTAKEELSLIFQREWDRVGIRTIDSGTSGWGDDGARHNHNGKALVLKNMDEPNPIDQNC